MSDKEKNEEKPVVAKTAVDLQRLKLTKLMKNMDKPIILPERPKAKSTPSVPEFVRNVMGSSAGAGSGEFHVYRHLRRKEYARQKFIQEKARKELLDAEYHQKLEENKRLAEEVTAKKREKRLKKKQGRKQKKYMKNAREATAITNEKYGEEDSSDKDSSDEDEENKTTETTFASTTIEANEESRIAETIKINEENKNIQNSEEDISKNENKTKTAMEKESSLYIDRSQENISKTPCKTLTEISKYENDT